MLKLFDGHMIHVSKRVIERAFSDNIHLFKFAPHITDILQPSDKCCFGALKRLWEKTFWHEGMSPENVRGFNSTGIWQFEPEFWYATKIGRIAVMAKTYQKHHQNQQTPKQKNQIWI